MASRYTGLPAFLKVKVDQKKKKETIRKNYDDCVLDKYMEINECGIRELEEAYEVDKKSIDEVLKLIKHYFFENKDTVIVKKNKKEIKDNNKLF